MKIKFIGKIIKVGDSYGFTIPSAFVRYMLNKEEEYEIEIKKVKECEQEEQEDAQSVQINSKENKKSIVVENVEEEHTKSETQIDTKNDQQ